MSDTQHNEQDNLDLESSLFIRTDDGETYGPADTDTLIDWCKEGRIEPQHELSPDQSNWTPAADHAALALNWLIPIDEDQNAGPYHLDFLVNMALNGELPPDTIILHKESGDSRPVIEPHTAPADQTEDEAPPPPTPIAPDKQDADQPQTETEPLESIPGAKPTAPNNTPPPSLPSPNEADTPIPAENETPAQETNQSAHEPASPTTPEDTPPSPKVIADEPESKQTENDFDIDPTLPTATRMELLHNSAITTRETLAKTREALKNLQSENTLLQDNYDNLLRNFETSEAKRQEADNSLTILQQTSSEQAAEIENLTDQLENLKQHYDRLQLENQQQFEQIDDLNSTILSKEQSYQREITLLNARIDAKNRIMESVADTLEQDDDLQSAKDPDAQQVRHHQLQSLQSENENLKRKIAEIQQDQVMQPAQSASRRTRSAPGCLWIATFSVIGIVLIAIMAFFFSCSRRSKISSATSSSEASELAGQPQHSAQSSTSNDDIPFNLPADSEMDLQPDVTPHTTNQSRPTEDRQNWPAWPNLDIERAHIRSNARHLQIIFKYGVFTSSTTMSDTAREDLSTLAQQLKNNINNIQIIIEGHTDATPVRANNTRYVDNFALGMARAEAVKDFLVEHGIGADKMRTASAGESAPPYSNDSETSRRLNRTVVITLAR